MQKMKLLQAGLLTQYFFKNINHILVIDSIQWAQWCKTKPCFK